LVPWALPYMKKPRGNTARLRGRIAGRHSQKSENIRRQLVDGVCTRHYIYKQTVDRFAFSFESHPPLRAYGFRPFRGGVVPKSTLGREKKHP